METLIACAATLLAGIVGFGLFLDWMNCCPWVRVDDGSYEEEYQRWALRQRESASDTWRPSEWELREMFANRE